MDQGRINLDASLALLDGLVSAGLERLVFSPGSRNTPLILAARLHPQLQASAAVDERSAAWQALGMARVSGRPVALACTSGTAVANWHPAVVEADRQGLPLVLLSADRPWELQHCGANQTIEQTNIFGAHVRAFHGLSAPGDDRDQSRRLRALGRQLARESLAANAGPVHLNFPFREPLVPQTLPDALDTVVVNALRPPHLTLAPDRVQALAERLAKGKGVIVCGPGEPLPLLLRLGQALGAPVLADPLSGLRFQQGEAPPLAHYDLFLRDVRLQERLRPDWILHCGATPVSKSLLAWLAVQSQADYWWVSPAGRWLDLPGHSVETLVASPELLAADLLSVLKEQPPAREDRFPLPLGGRGSGKGGDFHTDFHEGRHSTPQNMEKFPLPPGGEGRGEGGREMLTPSPTLPCARGRELPVYFHVKQQPSATGAWLTAWQNLEQKAEEQLAAAPLPPEVVMLRLLLTRLPEDSLLFVANSLPVRFLDACSGVMDKSIALFGNRGASGIDGNLSTLAGLAAAWPGQGKAVGVLGDLAFFHDLNALALCREQDVMLLLFNNGGGAIFDYLPQRRLPGHEQGWRTPVPLDHEKLAAAFGIAYRRVRQVAEFDRALEELLPCSGPRLLEILIDAEASRQQYLDLTQRFMES